MDILTVFDNWLKANSAFSVQYTKYMRSLINKLFNNKCDVLKEIFEFNHFKKGKLSDVTRRFLVLCQCITQEELNHIQTGTGAITKWKLKTIQDYQSGLNAFVEFIEEECYNVECQWELDLKNEIGKYNKSSFSISYANSEIVEIFEARLLTWDRVYEKIIYPARLLNRIFNNSCVKRDYKKLLKNTLSNVKIIIDKEGTTTTIKNVKSIEIGLNGAVKAHTVSNDIFDVYTYNGTSNVKIKAENLIANLSIDHDDALENVLNQSVTSYPQLDKLSQIIADHEKQSAYYDPNDYRPYLKGDKRIKEWTKSVFLDCEAMLIDPKFARSLFNEIKALYTNDLSFTIMQNNLNSAKGKKKNP